jgi:hypothetical protein
MIAMDEILASFDQQYRVHHKSRSSK